jgi:hypothetical protein
MTDKCQMECHHTHAIDTGWASVTYKLSKETAKKFAHELKAGGRITVALLTAILEENKA